ncbi:MAG: pilus assembly protein PilM [Candidatus Omnitrophota bacterium]
MVKLDSIKNIDDIKKIYLKAKEYVLQLIPVPLSLGVEVSDNAIKLALLKQDSPGEASLIDYAIIPTAEKEVSDEAALSLAVKNMLSDKKLYNSTVAKIAVSGPGVDSKRLTLPFMPDNEIPQALRWEAREHFLFDIESSALDFDILGEITKDDGTKSIELIATLVQNRLIDSRIAIVKNADIPPVVITPAAYSLYNLYKLISDGNACDSVALIDIGASTTTILIISNGKVRFIRQLGCAGNDFTKAIMGTLASDKGKIELLLKDADELKKEVGIPDESMGQVRDGISLQQISYLLRPAIERLTGDIRMSLDHYASHFNEGSVAKIILTGGTSKLKNINSELSKRLSLPTETLGLPQGLKPRLNPQKLPGLKEDLPLLSAAIGAALNSIDKVNLIPAVYKRRKVRKIEEFSIRLIFIIICLIMVTSHMFNSVREKTFNKLIAARMPQQEKLKEFQDLHLKVTQKNFIMNRTLTNQAQLYYVFKALSNITPKAVYLEDLTISDRARNLLLEGVVLETAEAVEIVLTRFLRSLEDSHLFNNVSLVSSNDMDISGKKTLEFKINCRL